jgi:hypothetical protein
VCGVGGRWRWRLTLRRCGRRGWWSNRRRHRALLSLAGHDFFSVLPNIGQEGGWLETRVVVVRLTRPASIAAGTEPFWKQGSAVRRLHLGNAQRRCAGTPAALSSSHEALEPREEVGGFRPQGVWLGSLALLGRLDGPRFALSGSGRGWEPGLLWLVACPVTNLGHRSALS